MASESSVMLVIRAARPAFRNCQDKAAFAVHATFMAAGYILHLTGVPAFQDGVLTSCSVTEEVGMENWNEVDESYAFVYSRPEQSGSKRVLMKGLVLNEQLFVDVLKEGDSEDLHHLQVDTMEYVENDGRTSYSSHFKNLAKLVADVNKELLNKLDGSSISTASSSDQSTSSSSTQVYYGLPIHEYAYAWFYPSSPSILNIGPNGLQIPQHNFYGIPAAGTMANGAGYPNGIWRPRPQTPTNFGRALCARLGRGTLPVTRTRFCRR